MKNKIILSLIGVLTLGSFAYADIQAPPKAQWNWSRKLSRSVANLAYGVSEVPVHWQKVERIDGANAAASSMVVEGTVRTAVRLGYGVFELVTFPAPVYKGGYRPPYYSNDRFDTWHGYQEFPPQVGFMSQTRYSRGLSW
jgi:putative exosortase-associated protein (TIGR04073 family)